MRLDRVGTDRYGRTLAMVDGPRGDLSCWQLRRGQAIYKPEWDNDGRVAQHCPVTAERLHAEIRSGPPVLLVHGTVDDVVPVGHLAEVDEALRELGLDATTHTSPGIRSTVGAGQPSCGGRICASRARRSLGGCCRGAVNHGRNRDQVHFTQSLEEIGDDSDAT